METDIQSMLQVARDHYDQRFPESTIASAYVEAVKTAIRVAFDGHGAEPDEIGFARLLSYCDWAQMKVIVPTNDLGFSEKMIFQMCEDPVVNALKEAGFQHYFVVNEGWGGKKISCSFIYMDIPESLPAAPQEPLPVPFGGSVDSIYAMVNTLCNALVNDLRTFLDFETEDEERVEAAVEEFFNLYPIEIARGRPTEATHLRWLTDMHVRHQAFMETPEVFSVDDYVAFIEQEMRKLAELL